MKAIVKNQTEQIISLYISPTKRVEVPASDGYTTGQTDLLDTLTRDELSKADDVIFHIKEGNIILNNGTVDLGWLDAIDYLRNYRFEVDIHTKHTSDDRLRVAIEKTNISRKTIYSHDWTDPTTWYEQSVRVVDEVATDSGDQLQYTLANNNIIDTYHGKLSEEDYLTDDDGYSYRVIVKVNDVEKTEQDPHYGTGGDYTVDYDDGYIDFLASLDPEDEVKVTYHYENGSRFTLKPLSDRCIDLSMCEIQFSTDIEINDTIIFATYGLADVFAPGYYPAGTMIPLTDPIKYKTIMDFYNDTVRSYPKIQPLGGSGWRGCNFDTIVLDWDYVSAVRLHGEYGMEIRVYLEHEAPMSGSYATATFYCVSNSDCTH